MTVVSITDEIAGLTLDQARRGLDSAMAERPRTSHVFCRKLRLDGPWGRVAYGDIVHSSHPSVAGNEEWFTETSIGVGLGPGFTEERAARRMRLAGYEWRPSRPQARRAVSRKSITPASPTSTTLVAKAPEASRHP